MLVVRDHALELSRVLIAVVWKHVSYYPLKQVGVSTLRLAGLEREYTPHQRLQSEQECGIDSYPYSPEPFLADQRATP